MLKVADLTVLGVYDVWIGDSPESSPGWQANNQRCISNIGSHGIANCDLQGQYVIFQMTAASTPEILLAEIEVFDQTDIAPLGTLSHQGVTSWYSSSNYMAVGDLVGVTSDAKYCAKGIVNDPTGDFSVKV